MRIGKAGRRRLVMGFKLQQAWVCDGDDDTEAKDRIEIFTRNSLWLSVFAQNIIYDIHLLFIPYVFCAYIHTRTSFFAHRS